MVQFFCKEFYFYMLSPSIGWATIEDEGRGVVRLQVIRATSGRMGGWEGAA